MNNRNHAVQQQQPYYSNSLAIRQEIQRFESVHPSIYAIYDLLELIPDPLLAQQIREHVVCIEDSFVNSQEWTLSRNVPDLRLGIVGSLSSGKSALVHRYLTGSYMQDESPEGGRFKKEVVIEGQSYLLLIRDEGGTPELQFSCWVDAVLLVFSLENEPSFNALYNYYTKMAHFRNAGDLPLILVGTQDAISESNPRVIDDARARKLASDLKRCSYYETCATYGLNVERVFQDACQKIVQQKLTSVTPTNSRPSTPLGHPLRSNYFMPSATGPTGTAPGLPPSSNNSATAAAVAAVVNATMSTSVGITNNGFAAHSPASSTSLTGGGVGGIPSSMTQQQQAPSLVNSNSVHANSYNNTSTGASTVAASSPNHSTNHHQGNAQNKAEVGVTIRDRDSSSVKDRLERPSIIEPPSHVGGVGHLTVTNSVSTGPGVGVGGKEGKELTTPCSTPTTSRKTRRRSNLFPVNPLKKGDDDKKLRNGEVGSGRVIPIRQGYLYKRSCKALNKEWKKKYVTLTNDGRLTYHPSLHDYMDDVHGKEIPLMHTTVKIPGQKPRGSRGAQCIGGGLGGTNNSTITSTSNSSHQVNELASDLGGLTVAGGGVLNGSESHLISPLVPNTSPLLSKLDTPNVKKRHRRMKSTGAKNLDTLEAGDSDGYEFVVVSLDNKQWHFEATNTEDREAWVTAIEQQILNSLQSNESSKTKSRTNAVDQASIQAIRSTVPGNAHCVDCDSPNPDWASLNLGALICIECSGVHRNLGSHISRVRSLDLDDWSPEYLGVMLSLGNAAANSIWEANTRGRAKPTPNSSREEKERWIRTKYEFKEFLPLTTNSSIPMGQQLIEAVCKSDIKGIALVLALASAAGNLTEQVNSTVGPRDSRTAIHLAAAMGNLTITQILLWNNANVKAVDSEGRSALVYAKSAGSQEVQDLLVHSGCPENTSSMAPLNSGTLSRRRGSISSTKKNNNTSSEVFEKLPASII